MPKPHAGFWSDRRDPQYAHHILECPFDTCKGAKDSSDTCWEWASYNDSFCDADKQLCTSGSTGPLCAVCKTNFILGTMKKECGDCPPGETFMETMSQLPLVTTGETR